MVFSPDGSAVVRAHLRDESGDGPAALGARVCAELLRQGARDIIEDIPH
jgi:hydroxymethylbilane synthase